MWGEFEEVDPHVHIHLFGVVNVQVLVGVHRHNQGADVGLQKQKIRTNTGEAWIRCTYSYVHFDGWLWKNANY